jgi:hypothetical protein
MVPPPVPLLETVRSNVVGVVVPHETGVELAFRGDGEPVAKSAELLSGVRASTANTEKSSGVR